MRENVASADHSFVSTRLNDDSGHPADQDQISAFPNIEIFISKLNSFFLRRSVALVVRVTPGWKLNVEEPVGGPALTPPLTHS